MGNTQTIVDALIKEGTQLLRAPRRPVDFTTGILEAEDFLNRIEKFPHLYVFGCLMDRQISYGKAWAIPYTIGKEIGGFAFRDYRQLKLNQLRKIFRDKRLHWLWNVMAENLYLAIQDIHVKYRDDASRIWKDTPPSALVIRRFLEFRGIGPKIATMATNILVREFKVSMRELSSIDISPDVRVMRFFKENGLLRANGTRDELVCLAREISPRYPGVLDVGAFRRGGR